MTEPIVPNEAITAPDDEREDASPQPWPSMCALTMYISFGYRVPTFVQYTSSRGPFFAGSA